MRELATALRRRVAYVIEVASAFDAVGECHKARSTEPIAGVILSPECELYDPAAFINAFERVDPAVPLLLAVQGARPSRRNCVRGLRSRSGSSISTTRYACPSMYRSQISRRSRTRSCVSSR